MAKIILASHGDFSKGVRHALGMIVGGLSESVETYSLYPGDSAADYARSIESDIKENPGLFVIITDIIGGSVFNELLVLRRYPNVRIISGMSLPLVLELVLNNDENLDDGKIDDISNRAKEGIKVFAFETDASCSEDEDF
ncbi:MAG: hypothetical protein LBG29_01090 [Synergistaceae bacterium]|nr:hypothetical protein [Synergistaceae bacterium]